MSDRIERRRCPRVKVRWPVAVLTGYGKIKGETRNITFDGVFVCREEPLRVNVIFRLRITPPSHRTIEVSGKAIWSDPGVVKIISLTGPDGSS